jgi:hypothetical protein
VILKDFPQNAIWISKEIKTQNQLLRERDKRKKRKKKVSLTAYFLLFKKKT